MAVNETQDSKAVTIPYPYYKNAFGGQGWPTRCDNVLGPAHIVYSMRAASPRPLYIPLWLPIPWISCMLTLPASRPHWSQTSHLELLTSRCSKTILQNVLAYVIPDQTAKSVTKFLYQGYISISGAPARLLSDRGANFMSNMIKEMCKILGIKKLWTMPYHPQTNGLVERSHQMIVWMIRKLGEDKKADWPSHLAEIGHAYNATHSAVTRYSPHYLMFRRRPGVPVNFYFPTVGSSKAPTREASAKHVDEYIASVWERLRTTLWEAQAQLMTEVCQQKHYYDRKIGTVNLKPGNLVPVKEDAFKGKRKIQDRWEEDTWEVVCQIAMDVPSYKMTNQHRRSWVLHRNWLLLIVSRGWHSLVYRHLSCMGQVYQSNPTQAHLCGRWNEDDATGE